MSDEFTRLNPHLIHTPTPKFTQRVTQITVARCGETVIDATATQVTIVDDAGGEYVTVDQSASLENSRIAISPEEWPTLRDAIDRMVALCIIEREACNACE